MDAIVLAPLFPCNLLGPSDLDNYKLIIGGDMRFDHLLLAMVDEVSGKYRLKDRGLLLHGFSGGGHFAHRFAFLHPERLLGVSVGAPGVVTLLDLERDWWVGVRNLEEVFGKPLDLEALRKVPVHMVVGASDTDTWEITIPETSGWWMEGANDAGKTRIDRLTSLSRSFREHGVAVQLDLVPGIAHDGWAVLDPVKIFFARCMRQHGD
jgi:pimeloyl-ACP methyl ester carboxylesterase